MNPVLTRVRLGMVAVLAGILSALIVPILPVSAGSVQGGVWAWGYGGYGQLGEGSTSSTSTPTPLNAPDSAIDVSAGCYHSLAIKPDNTVWAWGYNGFGQLGIGTDANVAVPTQISGLTATAVAAAAITVWRLRLTGRSGPGATTALANSGSAARRPTRAPGSAVAALTAARRQCKSPV